MHEADFGGCLRDGFETEGCERADVTADSGQWDTKGGEIGGVERAFVAASGDGDDAAEGGGALEEREEVSGEAEAGVEIDGGQQVQIFGCFCGSWSIPSYLLFCFRFVRGLRVDTSSIHGG